jgi:hypothetical protein
VLVESPRNALAALHWDPHYQFRGRGRTEVSPRNGLPEGVVFEYSCSPSYMLV